MKTFITQKIVKPIVQIYADYIIKMLEINAKSSFGSLEFYEQIMANAVALDYVCSEELGIDLD